MQCLGKKQQNLLSTWTIRAVLANDLFTDDSFVVSSYTHSTITVNFNTHCFTRFVDHFLSVNFMHFDCAFISAIVSELRP